MRGEKRDKRGEKEDRREEEGVNRGVKSREE